MNDARLEATKNCGAKCDAEVERFARLVQKGGCPNVDEFLKLPEETKAIAIKTFRAIKRLPDRFFSSEIEDIIVNRLGLQNFHPFLHALNRAGYLVRKNDESGRIFYVISEFARNLDDERLAADIVAKTPTMMESTKPRRVTVSEPWQSSSIH